MPGTRRNTAAVAMCLGAWLLGCGGASGAGGDGGVPTSNGPPIVSPSATPYSLVIGQSTQLDAHAIDPDSDALTYSWSQTLPASPQGSFSSQTSASPSWTAPTVAATTTFLLSVTVSDGHGHSTPWPVTVYTKTSTDPSFTADIRPLMIQCFGACHRSAPGIDPPMADYSTLMTWRTTYECQGQPLVRPGEPDNSPFLKVMVGASCGHQMPPDGPYLGSTEVNLVRTWILNGAPDN